MANQREVARALQLTGSFRLAAVADTHSAPHPRLLPLLRELRPEAILHAGDIGNLSVIEELASVAPVIAVRGNIDVAAPDLPESLTLDVLAGGARLLRLVLTHIAVNGPRLRKDALALAQAQSSQLVVCGHSHVPFIGRDRGVSVFNPGSAGPRRLRLPIVFGTMQFGNGKLHLAHVDCETGEPWSPPTSPALHRV